MPTLELEKKKSMRITRILVTLASSLLICASAAAGVHYIADFEGAVGPEWSKSLVGQTPNGARKFLGRFGNETVTLSLTNLPAHTNIVLSFDLLVIQTWDGNAGPDVWEVRRADDPATPLLHTTFGSAR